MPTPTPAKLQIPRKEAEQKIEEQIEKGSQIWGDLDQELLREIPTDVDEIFLGAEADREKWAKFTVHLLKTIFSDDSRRSARMPRSEERGGMAARSKAEANSLLVYKSPAR